MQTLLTVSAAEERFIFTYSDGLTANTAQLFGQRRGRRCGGLRFFLGGISLDTRSIKLPEYSLYISQSTLYIAMHYSLLYLPEYSQGSGRCPTVCRDGGGGVCVGWGAPTRRPVSSGPAGSTSPALLGSLAAGGCTRGSGFWKGMSCSFPRSLQVRTRGYCLIQQWWRD